MYILLALRPIIFSRRWEEIRNKVEKPFFRAVFMCEDATERAEGNEAYMNTARKKGFVRTSFFVKKKNRPLVFFALSFSVPICPHLSRPQL